MVENVVISLVYDRAVERFAGKLFCHLEATNAPTHDHDTVSSGAGSSGAMPRERENGAWRRMLFTH
jgi:hypothetical protein